MELGLLEKAIIAAVFKGYVREEELLNLFKGVEPRLVREALDRLVSSGILVREVRARLLVFRETVYRLTERGLREAERALRDVREAAERALEARASGAPAPGWAAWLIPLAAALGLVVVAGALAEAWEDWEEYGEEAEPEEGEWEADMDLEL